jgi:hypothetical protein
MTSEVRILFPPQILSGSSSVGRAIAFQAIGREFEPRLPLLPAIAFGEGWLYIGALCLDGQAHLRQGFGGQAVVAQW